MDLPTLLPGWWRWCSRCAAAPPVLLELWWQPRRTRRRVATLLMYEVNLNVRTMALHTYQREHHPRQVSADFRLSRLAFDAVAPEIAELPPKVASDVIALYHRFDHLHVLRETFSRIHVEWRAAEAAGQGASRSLGGTVSPPSTASTSTSTLR
jgi:hypothetical protein